MLFLHLRFSSYISSSSSSFHLQLSLENRGEVRTFSTDIYQVLHAVMDSGCPGGEGVKNMYAGEQRSTESRDIYIEKRWHFTMFCPLEGHRRDFYLMVIYREGIQEGTFAAFIRTWGEPGGSRPQSLHRNCYMVVESKQKNCYCIGSDDKNWSNFIFHYIILIRKQAVKNWNNKKMCWQISFLRYRLLVCSSLIITKTYILRKKECV